MMRWSGYTILCLWEGQALVNFYRELIESILTGKGMNSNGLCMAQGWRALQQGIGTQRLLNSSI